MHIYEPTGTRAAVALELLSEGEAVTFRNLQIQLASGGVLACRVFSHWMADNVNLARAKDELAAGKQTLDHLLEASPGFAAVCDRPRYWELLDDYGMGAVRLCHLEDELVVWEKGFPRC